MTHDVLPEYSRSPSTPLRGAWVEAASDGDKPTVQRPSLAWVLANKLKAENYPSELVARDLAIVQLREANWSFGQIGRAMGLSRVSIIEAVKRVERAVSGDYIAPGKNRVRRVGLTLKYPWRDWARRSPITLESGVDFHVPVQQFRNNAGNWARRNGLRVSIRKSNDREFVVTFFGTRTMRPADPANLPVFLPTNVLPNRKPRFHAKGIGEKSRCERVPTLDMSTSTPRAKAPQDQLCFHCFGKSPSLSE